MNDSSGGKELPADENPEDDLVKGTESTVDDPADSAVKLTNEEMNSLKDQKKLKKKKLTKKQREQKRLEDMQKKSLEPAKSVPVTIVKDVHAATDDAIEQDDKHFIYQRYCHVYKEGELEDLCSSVPGVRIVDRGFDKSNWFIVLQKYDLQLDERLLVSSNDHDLIPTGLCSVIPTAPDRIQTTK